MSENSTHLFAVFNNYPIFPVAIILLGAIAFAPLFCLLYIAQITPLHSNCRYILCIWALSLGAVFIVTLWAAILNLHSETGYMPLTQFTNDCRSNLYQMHVMSSAFCDLSEIALSVERLASIVKPVRYHFSTFAWFVLLPLTAFFMAASYGIDYCLHGSHPFVGIAILALIEASVLAMGSAAIIISRSQYGSSYGKACLTVRYQVKQACEMSRAMIPAYVASFALKATTIVVLAYFFSGRAHHESMVGFVEGYYSLVFEINGIFSLTILLLKHPQLRKQTTRKFRLLFRIQLVKKVKVSSVNSDTEAYFRMLEASWK